MESEHQELEETYGSEDAALRIALAEAEMEISLLKIELMRTQKRLDESEAALRRRTEPRAHDTTVDELRHSQILERVRRTSAPPSVGPRDTVFTTTELPPLPRERSAPPKIGTGSGR